MTRGLVQEICWQLPDWVDDLIETWPGQYDSDAGRMRLAIAVAATNVKAGSGGPFGAAVFSEKSELVAVGMNLVTSTQNSCAHAEIVALSLAQQSIGQFDLAAVGRFELVTTTDPCAMCLGAIPWSGVVRLVCGANGADAEAVGFDEGAKPQDWIGALAERGIETVTGVEREAAAAVLQAYQQAGGEIYNSSRS